MQYPLISEYVEAIRMAEDNLDELTNLSSVLDDDGNPVMSSGNFAVVFKMKDRESGKLFALKCFTREQPAREENYLRITEELSYVSSPYILNVRYLPKELFVDTDQSNEDEFPVLVMDWVEGVPLDVYLRKCRNKLTDLLALSYKFCRMALWLWSQPFAHGDLKPDNILVDRKGDLTLVDYDGMYVPAMKGTKSRELGSANFRHPERTEEWFDKSIDDFPLALMALSLRAITLDPTLLNRYETKEALLFIEKDYRDIAHSKLYQEFCTHSSDKVMVRLLSLFQLTLARVPISNQYTNLIDIHQEEYVVDNKYQINNSSNLNVDRTKLQQLTPEQLYRLAGENYKKGNYQQAFVYYKQSAEHGYAAAQYMFGYCYYEGKGVDQDNKQAVAWYRKAAEQGYAYAQYMLGYCYYAGKGVEQDYKQAVAWYRKAAEQGNARAQCNLGVCYEYGQGVEQDNKQAVAWYRKAAEQGYARAQCNLGYCYDIGQGVDQDNKQAVAWYKKAAEQGDARAQCNLGVCYYIGQGVDQDNKQAVAWYRKAAEQGEATAQCNLGYCYYAGKGVEQDYKQAVAWYRKAAEQGNARAQCNLGVCYKYGQGVEQDYKQAVEWYRKAADQGDADAQCNLGVCYKNGQGVEQDYKQAVAWYEQAAKQGNEKAKKSLDDLLNPEITDEEYEEAITDEYGAEYTKGGLKLISVPEGLKSYTIKEGTKVIGYYEGAFAECTSLQSVVLPDSVMKIGYRAFSGCTSLQSVVIPDGVTYIGDYAFSGCTSLQSAVIPDSVTEIGSSAFYGCESLQSVVIPDGVTYIGDRAFEGCKSLQSVVIPDSVIQIGRNIFADCSSLHPVVLPDGVTYIEIEDDSPF